jgi:hypothetical protein
VRSPRLAKLTPRRRLALLGVLGVLGVLAIAGGLAACKRREPAVGRVTANPAFIHLAYPRWAPTMLRWRMDRPLGVGPLPTVFVHLLDGEGDVVRTFDHVLPREWRAGEIAEYPVDLHQSALGGALPPGEYRLAVGLVSDAGARWELEGEAVARREYAVARVDVPATDEALPMFYYSDKFFDIEPGRDAQYPATRWFEPEAALRAAEMAGPGTVFMVILIPGEDSPDFDLEIEAGAEQPALWVSSPCSQTQVQIAGAGRHSVRLPLAKAPVGSQGCEIRLAANFRLRPRDPSGRVRAASLEALSWSAS